MANPTAIVKATKTYYDDNKRYWPIEPTAVPTTFYPGEMIGADVNGYATHFDDTQDLTFLGLWAMQELLIDSTMVVGGLVQLRAYVDLPKTFTMPLLSGSASRLVDLGAPVYAADSGHVTKASIASPLNFANFVGYIVDVHGVDPAALTGTEVEIEPGWMAMQRIGGANSGFLVAPATGGKTYGTEVLNKTVFVPNTAAETLRLPPVASTTVGDKVTFIKTTAAVFAFTIQGNAAENVNGANTYASGTGQFATASLISDGTQWFVINKVT